MAGAPVVPPAPPAAPPAGETPPEEEEEAKEVIELVQLVTFTMAGETYALEIQQVEAIINLSGHPITRVPKAPHYIDGVINLRGEIVPVINTRRRLRLAEIERKPSNQIIILSFEEEKVKAGFLVDSVQEVIRLPESAIEPPSRVSESVDIEYLRGVGKIDNKIVIMLNAHRIVFGKQVEE
jgi:purine-binding chemotaxis protein CheW